MKFLKKLISCLMAGAVAAACLTVGAGAASIMDAKKTIDSGKSFTLKLSGEVENDYKIKLSKDGDLKLTVKGAANAIDIYVVDSDGANIKASDSSKEEKSGSISIFSDYTRFYWNGSTELVSGAVTYKDLDKGTYYIRIAHAGYASYSGAGKTTFTFTYPQGSSSDGKVTSIQIPLKKGSSMQLDAVLSGKGSVEWSSSDRSVVSVTNKGKITANKKGTAVITAKCGSSSYTISVKVT